MMDRLLQVHFHKQCKIGTIFMFIASVFTGQSGAVDSYKFRLGTEAIIPFSYALDRHSQHFWEMYRLGVSHPFNSNGTMKPDALNPSQRDRFFVDTTWGEDILQVDLCIQNISRIDRGVYVWALSQEGMRVKRLVSQFDVFVDVILPPGKVECEILESPYSSFLREVHCRATVGSDGDGQLICYQQGTKTTFQIPPIISVIDVKAVFWMDIKEDITCCSHEINYEKGPDDCNDFSQAALKPLETVQSTSAKLRSTEAHNIPISSPDSITTHTPNTMTMEYTSFGDETNSHDFTRFHIIYNVVYNVVCIFLLIIMICVCISCYANKREDKGTTDSDCCSARGDKNTNQESNV